MATFRAPRCVLGSLVLVLSLPFAAAAQTAAEAQLLNVINQSPGSAANYLDLAKLYYEQRRYDDAERILLRALTVLQREHAAARQTERAVVGAPLPPESATLRVGGDIKEPRKIKDVRPIYPADARAAGVEGIVIMEISVGRDGTVTNAKVVRSVPMLDEAALDAVRQWGFTPTLLNGAPVDVIMTVTINFSLH